jgi:multiple sugar transport system permease protein/putative aldouronate transport system permease protein
MSRVNRPAQRDVPAPRALSARAAVSDSDKIFYAVNGAILCLFLILVALPLLNVFANAFSGSDAVAAGRVSFWPLVKSPGGYLPGLSLDGFRAALKNQNILRGYGNTVLYTAAGTALNLALTVLAAYPLSRGDLPGKNGVMMFFAFTMIFNGGMIPNYLLMQQLHLLNTRWAMILPFAINVYNMVICRTFFMTTIPRELLEAAQMDGCTDFTFFLKIVLPLSKAVIAVIGLYYGVYHWNAYFNAFLYLTDAKLYPLQIVLRDILISSVVTPSMLEGADLGSYDLNLIHVLRYSLIIVACLPIWCVYPFVQKYFVQGVMIGSIKG